MLQSSNLVIINNICDMQIIDMGRQSNKVGAQSNANEKILYPDRTVPKPPKSHKWVLRASGDRKVSVAAW